MIFCIPLPSPSLLPLLSPLLSSALLAPLAPRPPRPSRPPSLSSTPERATGAIVNRENRRYCCCTDAACTRHRGILWRLKPDYARAYPPVHAPASGVQVFGFKVHQITQP